MSDTKKSDLNWVERKARRELILKDQANDVWQSARGAIQDCCESFRKHYSYPTVEDKLENGHRIRVTVGFSTEDAFRGRVPQKRIVLIAFDSKVPCIAVITDGGSPSRFRIDADEDHAYIAHPGEITPDEFSRLAIEPALKVEDLR